MEIKPQRLVLHDMQTIIPNSDSQEDEGAGTFKAPVPITSKITSEISIDEKTMQICYDSIADSGKRIEYEFGLIEEKNERCERESEGSLREGFKIGCAGVEDVIKSTCWRLQALSTELKEYTAENLKINQEANVLAGGNE